jgi:hypothetical protein
MLVKLLINLYKKQRYINIVRRINYLLLSKLIKFFIKLFKKDIARKLQLFLRLLGFSQIPFLKNN